MPGPLPVELRERAVSASDEVGIEQAAAMFRVGSASIKRWRGLRAKTGSVGHRPMGGKRARGIADKLEGAVEEKPDRILREFVHWLEAKLNEYVSISGVSRALRLAGYARRCKRLEAVERTRAGWADRRRAYLDEVASVPVEKLVFIDESGCQRGMQRRLAWARRGQRRVFRGLRNRGTVTTILSAIAVHGVVATMYGEGATTQEVFAAFLEHVLLPELPEGSVLVMDNLGAHQAESVRRVLEAHGVRVILLPPYSPELNPIECAWSKLKTFVRSLAPEALKDLHRAIVAGLNQITGDDARAWFRHCGYAA